MQEHVWLKSISARRVHAVIGLLSFALLGVAFYMEYQMMLEPCPLCMLQRIVFFIIGVVCLVSAAVGSERARKYLSIGAVLLAFMGIALALRHLYLQHLPEGELPACMPGLSYMVSAFPWQDVLRAMVMGTGDCGKVVWTFLGISIPGWTLVLFGLMVIVNIVIALQANQKTFPKEVKHYK